MNFVILATSVQEIKDGISDALENDGGLDYIQLIQQSSDLSRIISVIYGFVVTVIMILVPIVVALELAYICFPLMREQADKLIIKVENKGILGKAVGFTLRDARQAVFKSQTDSIGKHPLTLYLKMKCASMMMLMFIVAIILTGMDGFIGFVKSLIDGVITNIFY